MNQMPARKDFRQAEFELAEALNDADQKNGLLSRPPDCPSDEELRQFVAGKSSRPDALLVHLGDCPRCSQLLPSLHARSARISRLSLTLAATAVIVLAGWLILIRPSPVPSGVATIDLREMSPTRGSESSATTLITAVRRNGTVRILLPIGSEGRYDGDVLEEPGDRPVAQDSGEASVEDHAVVLNLSINLGKLNRGRYSLGLRHNRGEWAYYPVELK